MSFVPVEMGVGTPWKKWRNGEKRVSRNAQLTELAKFAFVLAQWATHANHDAT